MINLNANALNRMVSQLKKMENEPIRELRITCTFCNTKTRDTAKRKGICPSCDMKLQKRCIIGSDAYAGIRVFIVANDSNRLIGEYTPHYRQGIDFIADDIHANRGRGVNPRAITYTVAFVKDIFGAKLRHKFTTTENRISDLDVYMGVIEINKQQLEADSN